MDKRILVIASSDEMQGTKLPEVLRENGFACDLVPDEGAALRLTQTVAEDLVVCVAGTPGVDLPRVVDRIRGAFPYLPVLVLDHGSCLDTALQVFRLGACDYISLPAPCREIADRCRAAIEASRVERALPRIRREASRTPPAEGMIGRSRAIGEVYRLIECAAATECNILITGESGTGKELVARAVHERSAVRSGSFLAVNCAALSESLLASELFGHVKGAFTGAHCDRVGYFEAATGGTLFLDEIGSMPLSLQANLLRAVERREIVRVGDTRPIRVEARLIAATNEDMQEEIARGRFRLDLYFRLRVVDILLPPLRARRDDIPLLVEHAISQHNHRAHSAIKGVDRDALRALLTYSWPGNVRELLNAIERAMVVTRSEYIGLEDLPAEIRGSQSSRETPSDLRHAVHLYEGEYIRQTLQDVGGNREEAARRLGIDRATLYRKLARLPANQPAGTRVGSDAQDDSWEPRAE